MQEKYDGFSAVLLVKHSTGARDAQQNNQKTARLCVSGCFCNFLRHQKSVGSTHALKIASHQKPPTFEYSAPFAVGRVLRTSVTHCR